MITEERFQKFPEWLKRIVLFLKKLRIPAKIMYILVSVLATIWFLIRVIPKPSRATYPCMQMAAPVMSGFAIWILSISGAAFAFKNAKHKFIQTKYLAAGFFLILGIGAISIFMANSAKDSVAANSESLEIWYKPNVPLGEAKGMFPGRVVWGHNPKIASWDGKTGFWWEDRLTTRMKPINFLRKHC